MVADLAVLDAVMCPDDWDDRYWSFDPAWAPGGAVAATFEHRPLTPELVRALNPEADPAAVIAEVAAMGYPT